MHMALQLDDGSSPTRRVTVQVEIHCRDTRFGDVVALSGAAPELGSWQPAQAVRLDGSGWPKWRGQFDVCLESSSIFVEMKAIVIRSCGAVDWESFSGNRIVEVQQAAEGSAPTGPAPAAGPSGSESSRLCFVFGSAEDLRHSVSCPRPALQPVSPLDIGVHRSPRSPHSLAALQYSPPPAAGPALCSGPADREPPSFVLPRATFHPPAGAAPDLDLASPLASSGSCSPPALPADFVTPGAPPMAPACCLGQQGYSQAQHSAGYSLGPLYAHARLLSSPCGPGLAIAPPAPASAPTCILHRPPPQLPHQNTWGAGAGAGAGGRRASLRVGPPTAVGPLGLGQPRPSLAARRRSRSLSLPRIQESPLEEQEHGYIVHPPSTPQPVHRPYFDFQGVDVSGSSS
eukprot:tig00000681_g3054.t1